MINRNALAVISASLLAFGGLGRSDDVLVGGIGPAIAQVLGHRAAEQIDILLYHADAAPER